MQTAIGGAGWLFGPLLGAAVWLHLSDYFQTTLNLGATWKLVLGIVFVLLVVFLRHGLVGAIVDLWHLARPRKPQAQASAQPGAAATRPAPPTAAAARHKATQGSSGAILKVSGLSKRYGGLMANSEIDFSVDHGEIRGIIGPNGAGKSTFFKMLTCEVKPTAGTIVFDGRDITGMDVSDACQLGLTKSYQINQLFDRLTVRQNRAIAALGELRGKHEDRAQMVRYQRPETTVRLDARGELVISSAPRTAIELANEQISILCNALGGRFLQGGPPELVQPIYRVHEPPEADRVAGFERLVAQVAKQRGLPDDPWLYRRAADQGLAGYLQHLPTSGPGDRLARALHRQAMLLNGRSRFDAEPRAHFGVGEQIYSRFTAPMREMVGIQCHAQAIDRMVGASPRTRAEDEAIRAQVIEAGNRAKDTQRQLDHRLALQARLGDAQPALARPFADRVKVAVEGRRLLLGAADGVQRHFLEADVGAGDCGVALGVAPQHLQPAIAAQQAGKEAAPLSALHRAPVELHQPWA